MIRKLRAKFMLIIMSFSTLILLGVVTGIYVFLESGFRQESRITLQMALHRPPQRLSQGLAARPGMPEGFQRASVFVMMIGVDGQAQLLYSDRMDVEETDLPQIAQAILTSGKPTGELRQYNLRYMAESADGGMMVALMDTSGETWMVQRTIVASALMGLGALLVFFVASLLLSRWALKPVEYAWKQQRRFVSDASHELKTPLTVILANTGILKAHPHDTVQAQMNWVENTEQETLRMKGLVDNLLFLSKSDDAKLNPVHSEVNLSDLADGLSLRFESKAYEQGVSLQADIEPDVRLQGDQTQLEQLMAILLDNAVKYADTGSTVRLQVSSQAATARFSVHNRGAGIREAERPYLFDRFYRADESRSTEGYGLGLSIAKTIVDAHKGKIQVESGEKNGTCFSVTLPLQ